MKKGILLFFLAFSTSLAFSQTANDIISKCIDAMGGKEKLSSIKTLYKEGTIDFNGAPVKVQYWMVNQTSMRSQSEIAGMKSFSIVRKDSGWFYSQRSGLKKAQPMTHQSVRHAQYGLDIQSPFLDYKEKGYTVKYLGKDDGFDGSDAYKLELTVNDSLVITYFIDPDSYLIIGTRTKEITNGRTSVSRTNYSDYQKTADGYLFPMEIGRTKFNVIKVNTDIDKSLFTPTVQR